MNQPLLQSNSNINNVAPTQAELGINEQVETSYRKSRNQLYVSLFIFAALTALIIGLLVWAHHRNADIEHSSDHPNPATSSCDDTCQLFLFNSKQTTDIANRLDNDLVFLSSKTRLAGTQNSLDAASYVLKRFQSLGLSAKIDSYDTLVSYPISNYVAQVASNKSVIYQLKLTEAPVDGDPQTQNLDPTNGAYLTYNGYSASGDVTGRLLYINYCDYEDFYYVKHVLNRNINGSIVICRYGKTYRGAKAMIAEEFGAIGVLIYSDPQQDVQGHYNEIYPNGPYRPETSVQRGTVMYFSKFGGDPLTPNTVCKTGTTCSPKYTKDNSPVLPKIPIQPISYADATPLLSSLKGTAVSSLPGEMANDWQGGLNFPYYIGDTHEPELEVFVRINNIMSREVRTIQNVIATIPGEIEPDRLVILGNHRDSWVYGAVDPHEGTASLIELGSIFMNMYNNNNWRPRRTIMLCNWDGEEYGFLGSTEFVEDYFNNLTSQAITYINVDVSTSGFDLQIDGMPSLKEVVTQVAGNVIDQRTGNTVLQQWNNIVTPMGAGSDFTAFVARAGITSLMLTWGNNSWASVYPVYHSLYDDINYNKILDGKYLGQIALMQLWGLLALRFSNDYVLPINIGDYAVEVANYYYGIRDVAKANNIDNLLNWVNLENTAQSFMLNGLTATDYSIFLKEKITNLINSNQQSMINNTELRIWNDKLTLIERQYLFSSNIVLPKREISWYRHCLYASNYYNGYGATIMPGISDAITLTNNTATIQQFIDETNNNIYKASCFAIPPRETGFPIYNCTQTSY